MTMGARDLATFEHARPHLEAVAYRLLGSASEAEDAVQEAFIKWNKTDRHEIDSPPAWLTRVVTNECLHQLGSARARRESYVGQWLPEPLLDGDPMLGPAQITVQREAISFAMLCLLEAVPPRERAVFVLREAFAYSHAEIADVLGTSEAGSQQALARARRRLHAGRRQREVDPSVSRRVVEGFLDAARNGDVQRLSNLLSKDATSQADGGGEFPAARRTISGPRDVATYVCGLFRLSAEKSQLLGGPADVHHTTVNGDRCLLVVVNHRVLGAIIFGIDADKISDVRIQLAPDKLLRLDKMWSHRPPEPPLARL